MKTDRELFEDIFFSAPQDRSGIQNLLIVAAQLEPSIQIVCELTDRGTLPDPLDYLRELASQLATR